MQDNVTRERAAEALGICRGSVKKLIDDGILPATQAVPGAPWEIPVEALNSKAVKQGAGRIRARQPANLKKRRYNMTLFLPGFTEEGA
jgi:putative N-acetylmannosamine-6-phosphate epimerase